jgi:hypothetical protein
MEKDATPAQGYISRNFGCCDAIEDKHRQLLWLDDVAVGASRHQTILHLARRRQLAHKPQSQNQQDDGDGQSGNGRRASFAGFAVVG